MEDNLEKKESLEEVQLALFKACREVNEGTRHVQEHDSKLIQEMVKADAAIEVARMNNETMDRISKRETINRYVIGGLEFLGRAAGAFATITMFMAGMSYEKSDSMTSFALKDWYSKKGVNNDMKK